MHGCYENLISGYVDEGIQELTGFQPEKIVLKSEKTGLFPSKMIEQHYGGEDGFWDFILERDAEKCLMGCSIKGNGKSGPQIMDGKPSGLQLNHAYGVSDVIEFVDPFESENRKKIRLLRLRNPWGKSEFLGAWSAGSQEINKYRNMIQAYIDGLPKDEQFDMDADDGTFFISFEDWTDHFTTLFLNNDFPDHWTGVRFKSAWTKANSGGLPNAYSTELLQRYAKNPQFLIRPLEDTAVMFSLCQTGGRLPTKGEYHEYPFIETLHYANTAVFQIPDGQMILHEFDKDMLQLMTPVKRERENSGRLKLKAGQTYIFIPSTEIAGKRGTFYLSIYFNQPLRNVEVRRIFNPQDKNTKRDQMLPSLIAEEAEKKTKGIPAWKVQFIKESLG